MQDETVHNHCLTTRALADQITCYILLILLEIHACSNTSPCRFYFILAFSYILLLHMQYRTNCFEILTLLYNESYSKIILQFCHRF